ncbi:hypothetical protein B5G11_05790 [Drancourtella sp. An57]|nr:hypothetical protein B5G11_05790 [Drancourtella sp. An57]
MEIRQGASSEIGGRGNGRGKRNDRFPRLMAVAIRPETYVRRPANEFAFRRPMFLGPWLVALQKC